MIQFRDLFFTKQKEMKFLKSLLPADDLMTDIIISTAVIMIFAGLGFLSREFALDLQTNFFNLF